LLFALDSNSTNHLFNFKGEGIAIVDAGGGTVDVSTYRRTRQLNHRTFEEIAMPECQYTCSLLYSLIDPDVNV
jgi:molecular chaperone DnaK (HSP70)